MTGRADSTQSRRRIRIDHADDGAPHYHRTLWADTDDLDSDLYNLAVEISPPGEITRGAGISLSPAEVAGVVASMASWLALQAGRSDG